MLQQVLVQWVRNLQSADECEYKDILFAPRNLGKLALKIADVGPEASS